MKVAVIGATGRTGRLIVDEARRQGHEVVACTRRPGLLADVDELTTIVEGDASDPTTLRRALAGAEAGFPQSRAGIVHIPTQRKRLRPQSSQRCASTTWQGWW